MSALTSLLARLPETALICQRARYIQPKVTREGGVWYMTGFVETIRPTERDTDPGKFLTLVLLHVEWLGRQDLQFLINLSWQESDTKIGTAIIEVSYPRRVVLEPMDLVNKQLPAKPHSPRGKRGGEARS